MHVARLYARYGLIGNHADIGENTVFRQIGENDLIKILFPVLPFEGIYEVHGLFCPADGSEPVGESIRNLLQRSAGFIRSHQFGQGMTNIQNRSVAVV